ncbi:hypothetical protein [Rhizocola hellebori]|nr:hypothetical protein [Rhizocola hellebori]
MSIAVLAMAVVLAVRSRGPAEYAAELLVEIDRRGSKFVAPQCLARSSNIPMAITIYLVGTTTLGVTGGYVRGWQAIVYAVIAVIAGATTAVGVYRGAHRVTFRPEVIELPYVLGCRRIPWDQLAPNGPLQPHKAKHPITIITVRAPHFYRTFSSLVDNRFLAETIRQYVDNPHHRPQIGTAAEHDRLRQAIQLRP